MTLIRLFLEFCRVGLFSVGGGLATIPFLTDLGERTGWFTSGQLADMILVIAEFLQKFRQSKAVDAVFYGLRAASVALITAALLQVAKIALLFHQSPGAASAELFYWPAIVLAAVIFVLVKYTPLKKLHPICFIALAALAGVVLQM